MKFRGVAKFFRALFYFRKVKRFGDVPWYSKVIKENDKKLLHKARDPRTVVIDSVLADINFAIKNLGTEKETTKVTKWTALALKARIFLFEGTYEKYHNIGHNYKKWLKECVSASNELIKSGEYKIYTDMSDTSDAYRKLFSSTNAITKEVILAKSFSFAVPFTGNINFHTNSSSFGRPGVTKQLVNSYLMADGSRFTDIAGHDTLQFYYEMQNRDPRLAQTIRTPGFKPIGTNEQEVPDFSSSVTGYQFIKFLQSPSHFNSGNDNDLPLFRYAEILLDYAEAKAELGTLTQNDLDKSIRLIRDRVGMPNINMRKANVHPDPFLEKQYSNVSGPNKGVILEIRRERRIELVREGFRWWDLMRWADGQNVAKVFKGMYFPGPGKYDLDHNSSIDLIIYKGNEPTNLMNGVQYKSLSSMDLEHGENGGLMLINKDIGKKWVSPKDYLYPIPIQALQLNKNLKQNPGWPSP
jgi:hypothetical protein